MTAIGPYTIDRELGRGGFGIVFAARGPAGPVALKILTSSDAQARARFEREAQLARALGEAEGFVPVLDVGAAPGGQPYAVYPLLAGGTLRDRMKGPLPADEAVALVTTLARALGRAHARGLIHRDLKPENVLLAADGRPLVADLGLARVESREGSRLTETGFFGGTIGYAAPEQLDDLKKAAPAADVFSLGVILYELLTGTRPFPTSGLLAYAEAVRRAPAPPSSIVRSVPAWLDSVCARALAFDPRERIPDGGALAGALETRPAGRRLGLVLGLTGGLAVVAVAITVAAFASAGKTTPPIAPPKAPSPPPAPRVAPPLDEFAQAMATVTTLEETDDLAGARVAVAVALDLARGTEQRTSVLRRRLLLGLRAVDARETVETARELAPLATDPTEHALLERVGRQESVAVIEWTDLELRRAARPALVLLARAVAFDAMGWFEDAARAAKDAHAREPGLVPAWRLHGQLEVALAVEDNPDAPAHCAAARDAFEQVVASEPWDSRSWKFLFFVRQRLGVAAEQTLAEIEAALARTRRPAPLLCAHAAATLGRVPADVARALREIEAALALEPDLLDAYRLRASARMRAGDREGARKDLERFISEEPRGLELDDARRALAELDAGPRDEVASALARSSALEEEGDLPGAMEQANRAVESAATPERRLPAMRRQLVLCARVAASLPDFAHEVAASAYALEEVTKDEPEHGLLVKLAREGNNLASFLEWLDIEARRAARPTSPRLARAEILHKTENFGFAARECEAALVLDATSAIAWRERGLIALHAVQRNPDRSRAQEGFQIAQAALARAVGQLPDLLPAWAELIGVRRLLGWEPEITQAHVESLLARFPGSAALRCAHALALGEQRPQPWDRIERDGDAVLAIEPDHPTGLLLRGMGRLRQSKPEGRADLEEYLRKVPTGPDADDARATLRQFSSPR